MLITLPVVLLSAWLLESPQHVYSRTMTWDLLFNLAGAWHYYNGQAAHIDFHDPVGTLSFMLTAAGLWLRGPTVQALIVGELAVTTGVFVSAIAASMRRLPLLPTVIFVLFVCQLLLMPINIGDLVDDFSFAMSYNAYGWSILCVLALIWFVSPKRNSTFAWVDLIVSAALLMALFTSKLHTSLLPWG